jgi:DNA-directed RNA polymerase specialized sigma subunit
LGQAPAATERQTEKVEVEQLVLHLQTAYPHRDQAGGLQRLNLYFDRLAQIFAPELAQHAAYFSRSLNGATQVRDDLLNLGRATLLETLLAWKPEKGENGTPFSRQQVSICIKNRMRKFALIENRLVRLSPSVLRDVIKLNQCEGPESEEAFLETLRQEGRTPGYINRVLNHRQAARSDATCAFLNDEERDAAFPGCASPVETDEQSLLDLASNRHPTVHAAVLLNDARGVVLEALQELNPAQRRAILLRFNLAGDASNDELTFREMRALTNVSPQRNNQVFATALKRLKVKLAQRGIHSLDDCLA